MRRTLSSSLVGKLLLVILITWQRPAEAQTNELWVAGDHLIRFPSQPGEGFEKERLPIPGAMEPCPIQVPADHLYQGQIPLWSQNIVHDGQGNLLLFEVDGNVYNADGVLIGDAAATPSMNGQNCQVCLYSGLGMSFIPVTGYCGRYIVVSVIRQQVSGLVSSYRLRVALLDLGLKSDLIAYLGLEVPVMGKFLSILDDNYGLDIPESLSWVPQPVSGSNTPNENYAWDHEFNFIDHSPVSYDVIALENDDRHLMFVRGGDGLFVFFVQGQQLRQFMPGAIPAHYTWTAFDRYPFNVEHQFQPNLPDFDYYYNVNDGLPPAREYRSQLVMHQNGSSLRVAYSGYRFLPGSSEHRLQVVHWEFGLPAPGAPSVLGFIPVPGVNPRIYAVDQYPTSDQTQTDFQGLSIPWPAVGGLRYAPSGQKLLFTKSSQSIGSTLGYIDLTQACPTEIGAVCWASTYLLTSTPAEARKLADTRLAMGPAPNGPGQVLYMLGADAEGDYWLAGLSGPDAPEDAMWDPTLLSLENLCIRTDPSNPVQYRLLNDELRGSVHHQLLQDPVCCPALVEARDRSTIITDNCALQWEPGDNPFFNTRAPVHIATELRIAQGAHVTAQNMEFRFGEDAILIIEAGASLTCTNCLFTNACEDTRWKGIEVRGNFLGNQFGNPPTNQGKVVLRASTVQNAATGVLLGMSAPPWGFGAGGIVQASRSWVTEDDEFGEPVSFWKPTTFRNCRQGVRFLPYQNHQPNGTPHRNLSQFSDCVFTVDDGYPVAYDFQHHVNMHHVDGITFRACTFENSLPDDFFAMDEDYPGSQYLGHGIYSLDAHYSVSSSCNLVLPVGTPCPENDTRFSEFIGLDHGIHARGTTLRNYIVDRVKFKDNICGVYNDAVLGFTVKNSIFSIGNRNVDLTNPIEHPRWLGHHRGIYSRSAYAFSVDDNSLFKTPGSLPDRLTEGIVIGYSRDHNDYVFRNEGEDLSVGFVGEGVCASLEDSYTHVIGLQLICNTNTNDDKNLSSRKAEGAPQLEQFSHTIRTNQGNIWRPADNEFDEWVGWLTKKDYEMTTTNGNISYWHRGGSPYLPLSYDPMLNPALVSVIPEDNCASKLPPRIPAVPPPGMAPGVLHAAMADEKLAFGNNRYLYEQLIDGGDTDEVVQEIMDSWPQDAWDLRDYLLVRSPYLSVDALKAAMDRPVMPAAMKAEICIANPEATQRAGFIQWLEEECQYPIGASLVASIVASWDTRTYRTTLESTMADHHEAMSQAGNMLIAHYASDTMGFAVDSLRAVWQVIRTPAARYAEALGMMEGGHYTAASVLVAAIPQEHTRLKPLEVTEKDRMLALIGFMQTLHASGRHNGELTVAEQDQLEAIIDGQQDRPANWAQNILCFHYARCVAPWTGLAGEPKALPAIQEEQTVKPLPALTMFPNPANSWVAVNVELTGANEQALLRVLDMSGRQVQQHTVQGQQQQVVLDTRMLAMGSYLVELVNGGKSLATEKLIVQP